MKSQLLRNSDFIQKFSSMMVRLAFLLVFSLLIIKPTKAQPIEDVTFPSGSLIVNMGIVPQTVGNALKPYGMIYDLITNYGIPVRWVINQTKPKDGIDFSFNGVDYRGGPFLIEAQYRSTLVNQRIAFWQTQGVVTTTINSPLTLPVVKTLTVSSVPNWTLDKQNGKIALPFFVNAGIPPSAHGGTSSTNWKLPSQLNDCDDIFVMPHADPTWATHQNLFTWNLTSRGSIWTGCHAGSALENTYNPANPSQQMNFLTKKVTTPGPGIILPVIGSTAYAQNSLILWGNHDDGTLPYSYHDLQDPVMQFMGIIDPAVLNGSEQIFIPVKGVGSGWRESTSHGVYDPDHPEAATVPATENDVAAVVAYGYGFGDPNRGYVLMQASHNIGGTAPANIAAQRIFFNFSFLAGKVKTPSPDLVFDFPTIIAGATQELTFTLEGDRDISEFTPPNGSILWSSECGGVFSPNNTQTVNFTAPVVTSPTNCNITVTLTDACGRLYKSTSILIITCNLQVTTTLNPPCFGLTNGSIVMNITGGAPAYNWTWTRTGGGTGSGTGTTISNLASGTYNVTLRDNNGTGCSTSFTVTLTQNPQIVATATPVNALCNGGTGSVNLSVTGGTPGYTYAWTRTGGGFSATTQNLSGVTPGTYNVTVTDSRNCTTTASATVTQPLAITVSPSVTHILCNGQSTGSITLVPDLVTGGVPPYTYLWSNGSSAPTISNLAAGNYSVTVTDANGCSINSGAIAVNQPSAIIASANAAAIPCNGGTTTITVNASGGTGTLQYSLNGGTFQLSNQFTGITASPSPYIITVRDANNCTTTTSVTVTQPAPLTLSTSVVHPTCPPSADPPVNADGAINLTVNGGTGTKTFAWTASNGGIIPSGQEDDQNLTGLQAGTYTVVVTDANNCTATTSVTLNYLNPNPVQPGSINH